MACHAFHKSAYSRSVKELWEEATLAYNLPLSLLVVLMAGYWLLTLAGAIGSDALNLDLDADADLDGEPDIGGLSGSFLRGLNAGHVPFTIVLSVFILAMWMISVSLNHYFNPERSWALAGGVFAGSFVLAILGTKLITQPLVPFMRRLKEAENAPPVIGENGVVRSIRLDSTFGQVEVERPHGAPALLNARLDPDAEPLPRGARVAIVARDDGTGVYLARALPALSSPH